MLFGKYDYKTDLRVKQEEAYEEGMAKQKEEDEKQFAQKDAEVARQAAEIQQLKKQLAAALNR